MDMTLPELWFTAGVFLLCICAGGWAWRDAKQIYRDTGKGFLYWLNSITAVGLGLCAPAYIAAFILTLYA